MKILLLNASSTEISVNLTITISVILALAALISPSITAVINNRHLEKMKKIDVANANRRIDMNQLMIIFQEYITAASTVCALSKGDWALSLDHEASYKKGFLNCMLVVEESTQSMLVEIDNLITLQNWKEAETQLTELTYLFQAHLLNNEQIETE